MVTDFVVYGPHDGEKKLSDAEMDLSGQSSLASSGRSSTAASRVERVRHCIVPLLSKRLNGGFRLDALRTRNTANVLAGPGRSIVALARVPAGLGAPEIIYL